MVGLQGGLELAVGSLSPLGTASSNIRLLANDAPYAIGVPRTPFLTRIPSSWIKPTPATSLPLHPSRTDNPLSTDSISLFPVCLFSRRQASPGQKLSCTHFGSLSSQPSTWQPLGQTGAALESPGGLLSMYFWAPSLEPPMLR